MSFTWFPGHMRKALRRIESDAQQADVVLMLLDARMPATSRNALLEKTLKDRGKALIFVLHKVDLAQPPVTARWLNVLKQAGDDAIAASSSTGKGRSEIIADLQRLHRALVEKAKKRGMQSDVLRAMVVGIPNVGKSTLINKLAGAARAKTGRKPGLTRGPQYIWLSDGIELLDTPGVMVPGRLDESSLLPLAVTGTIREDVLPLDDLGPMMYRLLRERGLLDRVQPDVDGYEAWLSTLCRSRGFLLKGGEPDTRRALLFLLKGLREGRWGPLSLEEPS